MSNSTTSSRSSMSSASARLYSFEQLLELAASSGAQSSTTASANLLQLDAQRFAADILVESDESSSASSRASSRLSVHSLLSDDQDSEEEDGWTYGEGELRTDLSAEAIEQLRKAVHLALDKPSSYPAMSSSSPLSTSSSKPAAVLVSTNTANPNRLPLVYDNSFGGRFNNRRANPGAVFGRPRKSVPSGCGEVQNSNNTSNNADREIWRSSVLANRARRMEPQGPRASKEADSISWRRLEPGAQWAWNDNAGYIVVKD